MKAKKWKGLLVGTLLTTVSAIPLPAIAGANVGEEAPALSIDLINGGEASVAEHLGKRPVYLKFWATWCQYCVEEMPHLQSSFKKYGDKLAVIAVNVGLNDSEGNIKKLFSERNFDIPVAIDQKGEMTRSYSVIGTPTHVLIDKKGVVRYRSHLVTDQLDELLAVLIEEN